MNHPVVTGESTEKRLPAANAPKIGVHETTLYAWIRTEERPHGGGAQTPADIGSLQAELRALRQQNERLRTQRDILKKTLGILSEPPPSGTKG